MFSWLQRHTHTHTQAPEACFSCCLSVLLWSEPPLGFSCKEFLIVRAADAAHCMQALNEDGCMLGAKIVWIALMETRSVRRWAACRYLLQAHLFKMFISSSS